MMVIESFDRATAQWSPMITDQVTAVSLTWNRYYRVSLVKW